MPSLKNQEEIDAYYLANPAQPRAAGVMWPALIEDRIDSLFKIGLRPDTTVRNELFQPTGALGNYAVKVRLAYMLGWIGEDIYTDLLIVGRIRNRFAHTIEAKDFSDQKISAWLTNMNVYKLLPDLRTQGEERAKANPSLTNTVFVDIINDAIDDDQMGFRFCVDMMISHLNKCGANMERNLANLSSNWLTADGQDEQTPSPEKS